MEIEEKQQESWSKTKKTTRFKEEEELVEIVFDSDGGDDGGDRVDEAALLAATGRKKRVPSFKKVDRVNSGAVVALKNLEFMTGENIGGNDDWSKVEKQFHKLAVDHKLLHKTKFGECIGMEKTMEFAGELFDTLARRSGITSDSITKEELYDFWTQFTDQTFDSRLRIFFDMVDKDADGRITVEEVKEIMRLSASANNLSNIKERAEEYAVFIMQELDQDNLGFIEIQVLEKLLLQTLEQSPHNTTTTNNKVLRTLSNKQDTSKKHNPIKRGFKALSYFIEENWKRVWVIALWVSICVGLFTWKFIQYKNDAVFDVMGYCVTTSKGAAETLKFNMALILLPVCRNTITWLRTKSKLGVVVNFDDNINFHKVVAFGIAIGVALHAIPHLTCDFPRLLHATNAEYNPMKPFFGDSKPDNYWWFIKGTEGWTGLVMVVAMTIAYTLAAKTWFRRKPKLPKIKKTHIGYNVFWYSHHLFVLVYALLIVHGYYLYLTKKWYKKTTWMYIAVPMTIYACERLLRTFRSGYKSVKILKVVVYPGKEKERLLALYMSKPKGFKYSSGQYIVVKCLDVSPFEWHPFSITSAPGDNYISVHIKNQGDWTSEIIDVFVKLCKSVTGDDPRGVLQLDMLQGNNNIPRMPKLLIDGPYGAPAQDYKKYEVILLIGLGIGATPMISILKHVLNNIEQQKDIEQGMVESGIKNNKRKGFVTNHAYLYWVTREQGSFEWFKNVMNEVVENDKDGIIEIHNHCTSVYKKDDLRCALITMLQFLQHAKNGVDIVSGTKVKTHFGKPTWRSVFEDIALKEKGKRVGVFYCGPKELVGELKSLSLEFSRIDGGTTFDFHKENF